MNFALDLLDVVSDEAPDSLLGIVKRAAQEGSHLVVSRWLEAQAILETVATGGGRDLKTALGSEDATFVNAMLALAARSDGKKSDPSAIAFGQWARAAFSDQPQRYGELLNWCVHSAYPTLDAAGRELLMLGADALSASRPDSHGSSFELSGVKLGLAEKNSTLLARGLSHRHPLVGEMLARTSSKKTPWPVVAEIKVDGQFFPVNAASYAIALGDLKMLREVCKRVTCTDHQKSMGLSQAIDFALTSGLANDCTPEAAQCVAVCVAYGADLDHLKLGQRLSTQRVTLAAEVSDFVYQADSSYSMASLFISSSTGTESLFALTKLHNDYAMEINGAVAEFGARASLLHYAAACSSVELVNGLVKLGAQPLATDSRGLTPSDWARVHDKSFSHAALSRHLKGDALTSTESEPCSSDGLPPNPSLVTLVTGKAADKTTGESSYKDEWSSDESMPFYFSSEFEIISDLINIDSEVRPEKLVESSTVTQTQSGRDQIASSVSEAQASRGAALFSRLKSSQANISAKATAKDDARQAENQKDQKDQKEDSGQLNERNNKVSFRARA